MPISIAAIKTMAEEVAKDSNKLKYCDQDGNFKPLPDYQVKLRDFASKRLSQSYSPEIECKYRNLVALQEKIKLFLKDPPC